MKIRELINENKKLLKNNTEKIQLTAIEKDPSNIIYMDNPSEAVQLAAVKKNPNLLFHIGDEVSKIVIMTGILTLLKEGIKNQKNRDEDNEAGEDNKALYYFFELYEEFSELYPEWPEWNIIKKTLEAEGLD